MVDVRRICGDLAEGTLAPQFFLLERATEPSRAASKKVLAASDSQSPGVLVQSLDHRVRCATRIG